MNDNPYQSPLTSDERQPQTVDRSAPILRCIIVLQLIWIAAVGAMARGIVPESFGVFAFASPILPITMLVAPVVALYFARRLGTLKLALTALVEIAIFGLHFLALLPAVQ